MYHCSKHSGRQSIFSGSRSVTLAKGRADRALKPPLPMALRVAATPFFSNLRAKSDLLSSPAQSLPPGRCCRMDLGPPRPSLRKGCGHQGRMSNSVHIPISIPIVSFFCWFFRSCLFVNAGLSERDTRQMSWRLLRVPGAFVRERFHQMPGR